MTGFDLDLQGLQLAVAGLADLTVGILRKALHGDLLVGQLLGHLGQLVFGERDALGGQIGVELLHLVVHLLGLGQTVFLHLLELLVGGLAGRRLREHLLNVDHRNAGRRVLREHRRGQSSDRNRNEELLHGLSFLIPA
jgi:hypothetical protein